MSTEPETTRVVRSWLEDGVTVLPDRVLDAVLDQLPATPQRRSAWPARRLPEMNTAIKLALGAAAIVVVSLLGVNLLTGPPAPAVGGASPAPAASPSPQPSPEATPEPTPPALPADGRPVTAGEYYVPLGSTLQVVLTVPDGTTFNGLAIARDGTEPPERSFLSFWTIANITIDPCAAEWLDPPVGDTVGDLVEALATRGDFVDGPDPITVSGHPGQRVTLAVPEDLDFETCIGAQYTDWVEASNGGYRWSQGPGQIEELLIVDVDGERVMIDVSSFPETPADDLTRLEGIVDSIRFVMP